MHTCPSPVRIPGELGPVLYQIICGPVHAHTSHFLKIHLNYYLPMYTWAFQVVSPSGLPMKTLHTFILCPKRATRPRPCHSSRFNHPNNIGKGVKTITIMQFSPLPVTWSLLGPNTTQSIAYRILFLSTISRNFKTNCNYNNLLHVAVSVYVLMLTKSYRLVATCFPREALSGVTHYHL